MMWHGGYGDMGGYGMGGYWPGGFFIHGLIGWVFWLLVIAALVLLLRFLWQGGGNGRRKRAALDTLEDRYARGEVGRDEFMQKKQDLG